MTQAAPALIDGARNPAPPAGSFPRSFDMPGYFQGRARGIGMFEDRFKRPRLRLVVDTWGRWQGDIFALSEFFRYADGRSLRRDWRIIRAGENLLRATASDVIGEAEGRATENGIVWRYRMYVRMKTRQLAMSFHDRLYLEPDGIVINVNDAAKFGVRVGRLVLSFRRMG